jgi:alpha-ketoglutarate-dependent taurine dioxygenase
MCATLPRRVSTNPGIDTRAEASKWKPNTLIVWDNRFLQHCRVHNYVNERRHLIRTTVRGERPL